MSQHDEVPRRCGRCFEDGQLEQAIGIALESRRLDKLEEAVSRAPDQGATLDFALAVCQRLVISRTFRREVIDTWSSNIFSVRCALKTSGCTLLWPCLVIEAAEGRVFSLSWSVRRDVRPLHPCNPLCPLYMVRYSKSWEDGDVNTLVYDAQVMNCCSCCFNCFKSQGWHLRCSHLVHVCGIPRVVGQRNFGCKVQAFTWML